MPDDESAAPAPGSRPPATAPPSAVAPTGGLNLFLELADPSRLEELTREIGRRQTAIDDALEALHYVHYARFLPVPKDRPTHLVVVTEFDGSGDAYILDFAAVLGEVFDTILGFVKNPPPLPVARHPYAFLRFVREHDLPIAPWSAFGNRTVLELKEPPTTLRKAVADAAPAAIDRDDVQGNLLDGYRAQRARHYALRITRPEGAQQFLAGITGGDEGAYPQVTTAVRDAGAVKPERFLNIGLSFDGLRTIGVAEPTLGRFPQAFREGPAHEGRATANGDTGASDPRQWTLGRPGEPVDLLVSLYVKPAGASDASAAMRLDSEAGRLEGLFDRHGLRVVSRHDAQALPDDRFHFGYRDGIGQPRIAEAGTGAGVDSDWQPAAAAGDFLLGNGYLNHFGGNWIGEVPDKLPAALCDNATYAAVRMLRQDVPAFEAMLARESARLRIDPKLLAAKLMGRWRNGQPLSRSPEQQPDSPAEADINAFDYAPSTARTDVADDHHGLRCPVGAHVRRMNPRGALVAGRPHSRRLLRRGMPYGPAWPDAASQRPVSADDGADRDASPHPPVADDGIERGLFGLFLCADLETQFEFILRAWGNGDRAAAGIRGTQDPFIGSRAEGGTFNLPVAGQSEPSKVIVPRLTTTRGALYLLMPGIGGLKYLSKLATARPADTRRRSRTRAPAFDPEAFDPTAAAFRSDPYPEYANFRRHAPVAYVATYDAWWVFSHALVTEVCAHAYLFLKRPQPDPAKREAQGLFFMDPPRHGEVRPALDGLFDAATASSPEEARSAADRLLAPERTGTAFDFVAAYAKPLPRQVLMTLMGVPETDRQALGERIDVALAGNDLLASPADRRASDEAIAFLAGRFGETMEKQRCPAAPADPGLLCAMARSAAQPPLSMSPAERVKTAINFALGGYLSSEFLIGTGLHHLLSHPGQWDLLKSGEVAVDAAVQEMLRYDAPFQLADRWTARETVLGGVTIPAGRKVVVVYGSANRDEAVFGSDADRFDIGRRRPAGTEWGALGLSHGIHRCIGEPLIRRTLPIAFEALLRQRPGLALDGPPAWRADPYFRSLRRLPVVG